MSCKTCEFFKEARRDALFWVKIGWLDGYAMKSRFLSSGEVNYCPTCGVELKTLREDNDMDSAPTIDAVEVVRCKDCKFGVYEKGRGIYHTRCEILEFLFQDDDYCSYGERKEEDED